MPNMKTKPSKFATFLYHFDPIASADDNVDDNNMNVDYDDDMVTDNNMEDDNIYDSNNMNDNNMNKMTTSKKTTTWTMTT